MDTPLVPQTMSRGKKRGLSILLGLSVIFMLVVVILSFVKGSKKGHGGWVAIAFSILFFAFITLVQLRWVHADELEDRMKRMTIAQTLVLVFLCIAVLVVMQESGGGSSCDKPKGDLKEAIACLSSADTFGIVDPVPALANQHCWAKPSCFGTAETCLIWSNNQYVCGKGNTTGCKVDNSSSSVVSPQAVRSLLRERAASPGEMAVSDGTTWLKNIARLAALEGAKGGQVEEEKEQEEERALQRFKGEELDTAGSH